MQGMCKPLFFLLQKLNKNKNPLWDWDCSRESKCGRMETPWWQTDFSYLCGPISVWILAMRSAALFSPGLESWWQNISAHSQNSNKISPARWPLINLSLPLSAKLSKTGSESMMFTTIKFPASYARQFRYFIGVLLYLAVLYVLVGIQQDENLVGLCEH